MGGVGAPRRHGGEMAALPRNKEKGIFCPSSMTSERISTAAGGVA